MLLNLNRKFVVSDVLFHVLLTDYMAKARHSAESYVMQVCFFYCFFLVSGVIVVNALLFQNSR